MQLRGPDLGACRNCFGTSSNCCFSFGLQFMWVCHSYMLLTVHVFTWTTVSSRISYSWFYGTPSTRIAHFDIPFSDDRVSVVFMLAPYASRHISLAGLSTASARRTSYRGCADVVCCLFLTIDVVDLAAAVDVIPTPLIKVSGVASVLFFFFMLRFWCAPLH